jgi:hypothetical protein
VSRTSSVVHAAALALLLAGCVEPVQYGGPIPIDARGLEGRVASLCSFASGSVGCEALAPPERP